MLTIDVFADLACPWCYIGMHRLDAALAAHPAWRVEKRWRPFQLQPDLPPEGLPWRAFTEDKFGGWGRAQAAFRSVQQAAEADGLVFDFDRVATAPNTTDAHRLILWAAEQGDPWPLVEALFRGYFAEGLDPCDPEALAERAAAVGLDRAAARALLAGDRLRAEVVAGQAAAYELGVNGVPFYVLGGRYALSGAQSTEVFEGVLEQVMAPLAA